jgi:hypothetical protein
LSYNWKQTRLKHEFFLQKTYFLFVVVCVGVTVGVGGGGNGGCCGVVFKIRQFFAVYNPAIFRSGTDVTLIENSTGEFVVLLTFPLCKFYRAI